MKIKFIILLFLINILSCSSQKKPIPVGILHSLSGSMAISEKSVVNATLLAIEEINKGGGLLNGRMIEPVIVDGKSDLPTFSLGADKLINRDKVAVVFGCWTSASRKTVLPIFEKFHHLLFYPVQYEGLESSSNIIYTGAAPNQQIIPAVKWAMDHIGKKIFLVGSDYIFPRTANEIIKDQASTLGGEVIGEQYIKLGEKSTAEMIAAILKLKPDVILNTINGDSNISFFSELSKANAGKKKVPVISFSMGEPEIQSMKIEDLEGHYASWNYFQTNATPANIEFIKKYKEKFGQDQVIGDPMVAAYFGVHLWAQTVQQQKSTDVKIVRENLPNQSMNSPAGVISIDPRNNHTWKEVHIGQIRKDKLFDIVWSSKKSIEPVPFPITRSKEEWLEFLASLFKSWGGNWAKL